jgi:hypothetical protein
MAAMLSDVVVSSSIVVFLSGANDTSIQDTFPQQWHRFEAADHPPMTAVGFPNVWLFLSFRIERSRAANILQVFCGCPILATFANMAQVYKLGFHHTLHQHVTIITSSVPQDLTTLQQ